MSDDIEILNLNDPEFLEKFAAALGVEPGDTLEIVTSQFERTDGITPSIPVGAWEKLRDLSASTLKAIGCGQWDDPDESGNVLMLFPKEWYRHIPAGFIVEGISGESKTFKPGETDDDYRFGCLAYGIKVRP